MTRLGIQHMQLTMHKQIRTAEQEPHWNGQ